jgi:hypothetical protein
VVKVVLQADERRCEVESAPEAERFVCAQARRFSELEADLARAFAEIEAKRSYLAHGARSLQAWAESRGYGPRQVRQLLALGRALAASPRLEKKVRAGRVTTESAAEVGRLLADPAARREGVDESLWLRRAESLPAAAFKAEVTAAIEAANQGESTVPIRLQVSRRARDGFQRARRLASRGRSRLLTEGAAFAVVVDHYLERHDPVRCELPARRSESAGRGRNRRVPPRVRAEIERRSGGICEICRARRAVEKMHLRVAHADGGTRELDNLADACHQCHVLADAGFYTFSHFDAENRPTWDAHPDKFAVVRERAPPFEAARVRVRRGSGTTCRPQRVRERMKSPRASILTRVCSIESRSRTVTVSSSSVWPSTVAQNGVPTSSWRR